MIKDPPTQVFSGEKLQKVLAAAGVGSRRKVEELIAAGRVAVNGRIAKTGQRVQAAADLIEVDGRRIPTDLSRRYVMLNKPQGVISTASDPQGRRTVVDLVGEHERLFPVGRLDAASEGLILLTNDGELTQRLTHPSFAVLKTYIAEVDGVVRQKAVARLKGGIEIEGRVTLADAVKILSSSGRTAGKSVVEVTVHEGRKHVVRRMLEATGHPVYRLVRTRLGPLRLGRLASGGYRNLTVAEIAALYREVGL